MSTIRDAREGDFDGILRLFGQLWPERTLVASKLRDVFRRGLASDRQAYLCATDGEAGPVVGFGSITVLNSFSQQGPIANIDELVVDEGWRGRGVGTELLERLIGRARQLGCGRIDLHSQFRRTEAHAFYERRGFERRAYFFSMWLGARP
jgi:GNAT superfamily N-acetyltransferase